MIVGILTGGGDCPGLNAVIRSVVRKVANVGGSCVGILDGWRGLIKDLTRPLSVADTDGLIDRGGTILGTSRTNPYKDPKDRGPVEAIRASFAGHHLDAVVAIGGDDTLGVANKLWNEERLPMVGVPKTIDNDLSVTDFTFGFDTAVNVVVEAVDRIRTTAESHRRIMVIETMGREAGWIACFGGIAVAADYILIPEEPIDTEHLCEVLKRRRAEGKTYGLVVVSEGARFPETVALVQEQEIDQFGHVRLGGIGQAVADKIEEKTGIETRSVVLGHIQRGGAPSAFDRVLATRFGIHAAELVLKRDFGTMVALQGTRIISVPLQEGVATTKQLDLSYYEEAREFFRK